MDRAERFDEVFALFKQIKDKPGVCNEVTYTTVVQACLNRGNTLLARNYFREGHAKKLFGLNPVSCEGEFSIIDLHDYSVTYPTGVSTEVAHCYCLELLEGPLNKDSSFIVVTGQGDTLSEYMPTFFREHGYKVRVDPSNPGRFRCDK